jgi:hypothetical protein
VVGYLTEEWTDEQNGGQGKPRADDQPEAPQDTP